MRDNHAIQALISALLVAARTVSSHGGGHPLALRSIDDFLQCLAEAGPPMALQFVGQATFCDRELVPFDVSGFLASQQLAGALRTLGYDEMAFEESITPEAGLRLADMLASGLAGRLDKVVGESIGGIRLSELPGAQSGAETEEVDPEVLAAAHLSVAILGAEKLVRSTGDPWPWGLGMSVVRRVARAVGTSLSATIRGLELAGEPWTPARKAVAAVVHCLAILTDLAVSAPASRATGHAVLALTCHGFRDNVQASLSVAAASALEALLQRPKTSHGMVEPHIVRVCTLAHMLAGEMAARESTDELLELVVLCYDMGSRRQPSGQSFPLALADLLAWAVRPERPDKQRLWALLMVSVMGILPPGTRVRLADGSPAIVLLAGTPDPFRPTVVLNGRVVVAEKPVTIMSPTESVNVGGEQ